MKTTKKLRSAAGLTISMTILATLLTACGGGGGGSAAATTGTPTTTLNVTPGKGKMTGATVTIKDATGLVLGTATTTAACVAGVQIPATAIGPFIISVTCQTVACSYYDEKIQTNVSGTAAMPALQAVVPGVTSNIGVTAATNAAAQYALNTGAPLTAASITTANAAIRASLGLPAGTDILTPPTIIANNADYLAAKTGTGAANLLAYLSAAFAMSAKPGISAIQAIADYGDAWKNAAITPASGVIMPTNSIDTTELTLATSGVDGMTGVPSATIANIASAVAAADTNVTAVNHMYATGISVSGLRAWFSTGSSGVAADIITLSPSATANTYTYTGVTKELLV